MEALALDRRWLSRGVEADVRVLQNIELDEEQLSDALAKSDLADAIRHLGEVGSLLDPSPADLAALDAAIADAGAADLLGATLCKQLQEAHSQLEALSRQFDIVVANPPYLGNKSFQPFLTKWMRDNYPEEKSDLCYAFINRICGMKKPGGEAGITATNSWMFLSSSEASRKKTLDKNEITSLVQLSVHGFKGIAAQIFAFTLIDKQSCGYKGGYVRLNDFDHHSLQESKTLEAVRNPDCGWFYRADASTFHDIPGSPIAYWANSAVHEAFATGKPLSILSDVKQGLATGDNKRFVHLWWENAEDSTCRNATDRQFAKSSGKRWFPLAKGGEFRKWYGNIIHTVDWLDDGNEMKEGILKRYPYLTTPDFVVKNQQFYFKEGITWSAVSSSHIHLRHLPAGCIFDHSGDCVFSSETMSQIAQALLNSSVGASFLAVLAPTLSFDVGPVGRVPIIDTDQACSASISHKVNTCRNLSRQDWDSQETSWDFKRSPLL